MSGHTPGPWELESVLVGTWVTGPDGDAPVICDIVTRDPDGATDEDIANGHLIAAAPDLLDALARLTRAVLEAGQAYADTAQVTSGMREALYAAEEALAKARGETPRVRSLDRHRGGARHGVRRHAPRHVDG